MDVNASARRILRRMIAMSLLCFLVLSCAVIVLGLLPLYSNLKHDAEKAMLTLLKVRGDTLLDFINQRGNGTGGAANLSRSIDLLPSLHEDFGPTAQLWLLSAEESEPGMVAPVSGYDSTGDAPIQSFPDLLSAIAEARSGPNRPLARFMDAGVEKVVAYLRLRGTPYGMSLTMDASELYGRVNTRFAQIAIAALAIVAFGCLVLYRLQATAGQKLCTQICDLADEVDTQTLALGTSWPEATEDVPELQFPSTGGFDTGTETPTQLLSRIQSQLQTARTYSEMLQVLGKDNGTIGTGVKRISEATLRAEHCLRHITETGGNVEAPSVVDVVSIVRDVAPLIRRQAHDSISISFSLPNGPVSVYAGRNWLEDTCVGLLPLIPISESGSAVEVTVEPETISVDDCSDNSAMRPGNYVCIESTVNDPENSKFDRSASQCKIVIPAVMQNEVARLGGFIQTKYSGSSRSIQLFLPALHVTQTQNETGENTPLRVAVVEPDTFCRDFITRVLEEDAHTVVVAETSESISELLRSGPLPDAILIATTADADIPSLRKAITTDVPGIPIVQMRDPDAHFVGRDTDHSADMLLMKPFSAKALRKILAKHPGSPYSAS